MRSQAVISDAATGGLKCKEVAPSVLILFPKALSRSETCTACAHPSARACELLWFTTSCFLSSLWAHYNSFPSSIIEHSSFHGRRLRRLLTKTNCSDCLWSQPSCSLYEYWRLIPAEPVSESPPYWLLRLFSGFKYSAWSLCCFMIEILRCGLDSETHRRGKERGGGGGGGVFCL